MCIRDSLSDLLALWREGKIPISFTSYFAHAHIHAYWWWKKLMVTWLLLSHRSEVSGVVSASAHDYFEIYICCQCVLLDPCYALCRSFPVSVSNDGIGFESCPSKILALLTSQPKASFDALSETVDEVCMVVAIWASVLVVCSWCTGCVLWSGRNPPILPSISC